MRSGITLRNNLLPWVILSLWSLIIDIVLVVVVTVVVVVVVVVVA